MKIEKNIYTYSAVAIVIVGLAIFWMSRGDKNIDTVDATRSASPSPSPIINLPKNNPKPTPDLVVKEIGSYQYWAELLEPLNRRLTLNEKCTEVVPSQVAYPNNIQIMLDNTLSAEPRILKIGSKEYSIGARGWSLVTLSSTTLPAQLKMFCGSMELGQLDLE